MLLVLAACAADGAGTAEVVRIEATGCERPQPRHGVGTVVAEGVVLAAAHVVEGGLRDLLVDGSPAAVVGLDGDTDLALLAVIGPLPSAPSWRVTPRPDVGPGPVSIITPDGAIAARLNRTLTLQVEDVSAGTTSRRETLELDLVVEPGTSGSPVVDADGSVIGVVVLARASTGVSYASRLPALPDLLDNAAYLAVRAAGDAAKGGVLLDPPVACT
jgi:S1-C subfamily serine protease